MVVSKTTTAKKQNNMKIIIMPVYTKKQTVFDKGLSATYLNIDTFDKDPYIIITYRT